MKPLLPPRLFFAIFLICINATQVGAQDVCPQGEAIAIGKQILIDLVNSGQLDESWRLILNEKSAIHRNDGGGSGVWTITFFNANAPTEKQNLYILISDQKKVLSATFSQKF